MRLGPEGTAEQEGIERKPSWPLEEEQNGAGQIDRRQLPGRTARLSHKGMSHADVNHAKGHDHYGRNSQGSKPGEQSQDQGDATAEFREGRQRLPDSRHRHVRWHPAERALDLATNEKAIRLYKTLGFVEQGVGLKEIQRGPGQYVDVLWMYRFVK